MPKSFLKMDTVPKHKPVDHHKIQKQVLSDDLKQLSSMAGDTIGALRECN